MAGDGKRFSYDLYLEQVALVLIACRGKVLAAADEMCEESRRALAELEVRFFPEDLN